MEEQVDIVAEEALTLAASLSDAPGLFEIVKKTITQAGPTSPSKRGSSLLALPLLVCEAISGSYERAVPVAAAIRLLKAAAEVFDDVEDDDSSTSLAATYGTAVAVNAASALVFLAEKSLGRLKDRGVSEGVVVRILDTINSYHITTCAGQHLDISCHQASISEEEYLRIAALKSASHVECGCCAGAILAGADASLVSAFCRFGHNLGMAAQMANDIQGIISGTDIARGQVTLPVTYALEHADGDAVTELEVAFHLQSGPFTDPNQVRYLLFNCGAMHYAAVKMETFKQQAADALAEAEIAGASVAALKAFLA